MQYSEGCGSQTNSCTLFGRYNMAEVPATAHTKLDPAKLGEIVEAVVSISSKWDLFGIQVGVLSTTLDKIRVQFTNNPDGCLSEVLKQRLKAIDPELTWEIIVAALRTKIVGERRLAEEIEKKYCSSSVTGEQLDEVPAMLNSLKDKLESQLAFFKSIPSNRNQMEESKMTLIKGIVQDFVETSLQSGASGEAVRKELADMYANDILVSREVYEWASELVDAVSKPTSQPDQDEVVKRKPEKRPLFCKDTVYHSCLCCYAVSTCTAANYNEFFLKDFPQHLLEEVSFSRSQDRKDVDRYLIARQGKTYYVALRSEPLLTNWGKEFASFEKGIQTQGNRIPLRYFVQQLHDGYKVVFTGFSFGGLLAQSLTASMWQNPLLGDDLLKENVVCITFGQPLINLPVVLEAIEASPDLESTLHSVFVKEDLVPRMMQFFDPEFEEVCADVLNETDVLTPMKSPNAFKSSFAAKLLHHLSVLQDSEDEGSTAESALSALKALLKLVAPHILARSNCRLVGKMYMAQKELPHGLVWKQLHEGLEIQAELGMPKVPLIETLSLTLFKCHRMEGYYCDVIKSFANEPPSSTTVCNASFPDIPLVKPTPCSVAFHCHGKEIAVTVTGENLWFCHQVQVGPRKEDVTAEAVSQKLIQFHSSLEDDMELLASSSEIRVSLQSHFCKPIRKTVKVTHKVYRFSFRQEQLAKLTPSELIEVAYLSALLEQHPHNQLQSYSRRFDKLREFLVKIVSIVPIESLLHVIAQGEINVSVLCCLTLLYSKIQCPQSLMATKASISAFGRYAVLTEGHGDTTDSNTHEQEYHGLLPVASLMSGRPVKSLLKKSDKMLQLQTKSSKTPSQKTVLEKQAFYAQQNIKTYEFARMTELHSDNVTVVEICCWYLSQIVGNLHHSNEAICGLNLETIYSLMASKEEDNKILTSPIDILHEGRKKLLRLSQQQFQSGSLSSSNELEKKKQLSELYNSKMLEVVNSIRAKELRVCTSLLGAFMEEQFRVPLMKSSIDTAKLLDVAVSAVAMGVWAIFSLTLGDMQAVLNSIPSGRMLVDVTKYVRGIFKKETVAADEQYAGKLQFMVQGLEQTVSCNTHYVSYSLERQLIELCKTLKIDESIPLETLIADWDKIFKENVLSLVAVTHRPLIARWLKWALMVHHLREELAKYTTIGVIGLVNSGKSLLVSTLFDIKVPVGTTAMKRTTIPFLYNLDSLIDGLDVIDFPGVDDNDETIPDLADLLLALAQVVVFVVDYRKAHTESAKKWLEILQEKSVPVLVCLTFADKLYAEHMSEDGQHPELRQVKQELAKERAMIVEKLGSFPSNDVKFFSFCQDRDSVLNSADGRQRLREAGIESPDCVSEWLAGIFESQLDQDDLAKDLRALARKRLVPK